MAALSQVPKPALPDRPGPFPVGPPDFCSKRDAKAYEAAIYGPLDRALPPPIDGANPAWACVGPEGGEIVGLDFDRFDERKIFVAVYSGGVYRSTDSGDTWAKVTFSSYENIGIAVDPTNGQKVYVAGSSSLRRSCKSGTPGRDA